MKNLINLGKTLNKQEQKSINGGWNPNRPKGGNLVCDSDRDGVCKFYDSNCIEIYCVPGKLSV